MKITIGLIGAIVVALLVFLAVPFVAGRFLGQDTGMIADLQGQNSQLRIRKDLGTAQKEVTQLKQVNAGLQADLAGGRGVEEQREALVTRTQELDRREEELALAEKNYTEREAALRQREEEFHALTNVDQQEIGRAKQLQSEYEAMRQERDEALGLAEKWLMFLWGGTAIAILLILISIIFGLRYWSKTVQYRAESQQRQQAVQLLAATLGNSITPAQRQIIASSIEGYPGSASSENRRT